MDRVHDIGGKDGFGSLDLTESDAPFHSEWEARVFAINRLLLKNGIYTLDEFRYSVERLTPSEYRESSYYERWLLAMEQLLREKRVLDA